MLLLSAGAVLLATNTTCPTKDAGMRKVAVKVEKASTFRSRRVDCWDPGLQCAHRGQSSGVEEPCDSGYYSQPRLGSVNE